MRIEIVGVIKNDVVRTLIASLGTHCWVENKSLFS
jgi:hypothetical protein